MSKKWPQIRGDIIGGATAAVVALPLGIAFGIASGAGIMAGIYGSIFGGFVAAVFGGCGVQITGPTGAMMTVLATIIASHGLGGMLLVGLLSGLMQVIFGLLKFGKFVKYLPQPVIAGFTNGIAILFFIAAIDDALATLPITIITVAVIILALKFFKKIPESLFGLMAGLLVNEFFFHSPNVVGLVPFKIPSLTLSLMPFNQITSLIMPAFTICLLGSISALLSAEVTDEMVGARHNSNQELIGQGLGNIASALVGGMPVSGAVARSGVNVLSGGRTKLSSALHAIFLMIMIIALGPIVKRIPLASLAAILMVASMRTADWKSLKLVPKAPWKYGLIMTITTVLTVVKDLSIAVFVGVILAGLFAILELTASPKLNLANKVPLTVEVLAKYPNLKIISLEGPLFFVGAHKIKEIYELAENSPNIVLNFTAVNNLDETGALVLKKIISKFIEKGNIVYVGGLNRKPYNMLMRLGLADTIGKERIYRKIDIALVRANQEYHNNT